jgi:DNA-binding response OmpR family regulator
MSEKRILLVDDERQILDLMAQALLVERYSVDRVTTAAEAITSLDTHSYQLVISDWQLPDGDGLLIADTAAELGAKTMLMSGHLAQMRGGRAEQHETLMKPVELREFLHAVEEAIGKGDNQMDEPREPGCPAESG